MKKPNDYDSTSAGGYDYEPIALGGHTAIIKEVKEVNSKAGKPLVVVYIDFDNNDVQAGYFKKMFEEDTRQDKKWPYQAVQYISVVDSKGNCSRSFKSFCTSYEESNGMKVNWDLQRWPEQFKGKRLGVVYGEVEEEYNGEVKTRRRIRWNCDWNKAADAKIPNKRERERKAPSYENAFMPVSDDEDVPW